MHHMLQSPRVNSNNSYEHRLSAGSGKHNFGATTGQAASRAMVKLDPMAERENKLRIKKKLLMSDSLNMLTKQRNQNLSKSINNSNNSSKKRKPQAEEGTMCDFDQNSYNIVIRGALVSGDDGNFPNKMYTLQKAIAQSQDSNSN